MNYNLDIKDTPMLREEYRDLQRVALKMMGRGANSSEFKRLVNEEMLSLKLTSTPANYVLAATEVLRWIAFLETENALYRDLVG